MLIGKHNGGPSRGGPLQEDGRHCRLRLADHHGDAGFDNAGLLAGDQRQRIAQQVLVVVADVGDDAQQRRDDVGAVQPAAQPDFDDGDVHALAGKVVEGHGDAELEKGGLYILDDSAMAAHEIHHPPPGDVLSVHLDALPEVQVVRADVQAGFQPCGLADGGQQVADRALAIGAGHVYRRELVLRIPQTAA